MRKVLLIILCILSCVFAVYYYGAYEGTSHAATYHGFALLFAVEAVVSALSLFFFWRGVKSRWVTACYTTAAVLAFWVLLTTAVWVLYYLGIFLLPPPQS